MSENRSPRRFPIGAEVVSGGVSFRVWAPRAKTVSVSLEEGPGAKQMTPLQREEGGYFSALIACAAAGTRYRFQLDSAACFPDPASRFQPSGPHGPSQVVDPSTFPWTDHDWPGVKLRGQVFYEMHVGT